MNLSRSATVVAAAMILAGAAAVAVEATTGTDPVTLCASTKNGAVTVPGSNGSCPKGTTGFSVASDAAVEALQAQDATQAQAIQDLRQADRALEERLEAVEPGVFALTAMPYNGGGAEYEYTLVGTRLKPGEPVMIHLLDGDVPVDTQWMTSDEDGMLHPVVVEPDGTVNRSSLAWCGVTHVYLTTVRADGDPVTSNVIETGPGC